MSLKGLKFLSQSTDSLHKGGKVNASTESLTDEGSAFFFFCHTDCGYKWMRRLRLLYNVESKLLPMKARQPVQV